MELRYFAPWAFCLGLVCLCLGCGNEYRPVANPIIQPTGVPQQSRLALVVFQDTSNPTASGTCSDGSVPPCKGATSQIDVSGDTNLADVYVGRTPTQAVLGGQVAVADYNDDAISLFTLQSPGATAATIPTSSAPVFVAYASGGAYYVVNSAACPALSGSSSGGGCVTVLTSADTVAVTIPAGTNPVALAPTPDGSKVYIANQGSNSVTVFSTTDNTLITTASGLPVGSQPSYIIANSTIDAMYVLNRGDATISVIDAFTDATSPTPVSLLMAGQTAVGNSNYMVFNSQMQRLYVANPGTGQVSVLDASGVLNSSGTSNLPVLLANVAIPGGLGPVPVALPGPTQPVLPDSPPTIAPLADGSRVYVLGAATVGCKGEANEGQVWVINTSNNAIPCNTSQPNFGVACANVGACISVGGNPVAIASSGDSTKVYVAHQGASTNPDGSAIPPGTTIISVANNSATYTDSNTGNTVMNNVSAPNVLPNCPPVVSSDPNCINPTTGSATPVLMTPVFVTSQ
jgi:YVTN family beta-propeller protein